jgi:hypothetical protein
MTLEEKMYFDCTLNTTEDAERKAKIAENLAIDFAQWYFKKAEKYNSYLKLVADTKQLFEIYKKEKGL